MAMIETVRQFLRTCPLLSGQKIQVDYLGGDPTEYTVDGVPAEAVVKRYAGGDSVRQFVFVFASREFYGPDRLTNIANSSFYEDFAAWLEAQSRAGNLPALGGGKEAIGIEAMSTGYLYDSGSDNARYQIQCRLVYYQED